MASKGSKEFRKIFHLENRSILHWFPGHMVKGIKKVNKMLHKIDCIIEVHDARVPFTGRNTKFQKQLTETRPHYLILNKKDLCDLSWKEEVEKKVQKEEGVENVIYTDLRTRDDIKQLLPKVVDIVRGSERYQRADRTEINLLVTGIPNVGKSTFINQIVNLYTQRRGTVAKKGAKPGVTRSVQEKIKILSSPLVYVYDTPGILEPQFDNPVVDPLKLALCDLLSIDRIGIVNAADYLLFWLNKYEHFEYVDLLKLDEPVDNVEEFLTLVCIKNDFFQRRMDLAKKQSVLKPNFDLAANTFIRMFQKSQLGKFTLDVDKLRKTLGLF